MPGTFYPPPQVSDPDMHHGTCVTHLSWCMPGPLTDGFLWRRWRGKPYRHSRRMRSPPFYVSGKRPMEPFVACIKKLNKSFYTRPTLERRKTLGHLRSINPNTIIHFANQSQTCQLLKSWKKNFQTFHEKKLWKVVQSISGRTDIENPYRLLRASYTYTDSICRVRSLPP